MEQTSVKFWSIIKHFNFEENAFESVVCKLATILSRLQCVKNNKSVSIHSLHRSPIWQIMTVVRRRPTLMSEKYKPEAMLRLKNECDILH